MRVLIDDNWTDGFLDADAAEDECRVKVLVLRRIEAVGDLYFERPRRVGAVLEYLREIGPRAVVRKVRSRQAERYRNDRHVVCGIGEKLTSNGTAGDERVIFVGPISPACAERLVVPAALIRNEPGTIPMPDEGHLLYADQPADTEALTQLAGWDPRSGEHPAAELIAAALDEAEDALRTTDWSAARSLPLGGSGIRTRVPQRCPASGERLCASLVGYGNYAKTTILPNVSAELDITVIHEIDPLQIGPNPHDGVAWDTSGFPSEECDVVLIAGYHNTHGPLAAWSLRQGKAAIVEKPLVTSRAQLDELASALGDSAGSIRASKGGTRSSTHGSTRTSGPAHSTITASYSRSRSQNGIGIAGPYQAVA